MPFKALAPTFQKLFNSIHLDTPGINGRFGIDFFIPNFPHFSFKISMLQPRCFKVEGSTAICWERSVLTIKGLWLDMYLGIFLRLHNGNSFSQELQINTLSNFSRVGFFLLLLQVYLLLEGCRSLRS